MKLSDAIKDEKHDERKYDRAAQKRKKYKIALRSIASDEHKHAQMLKAMKK